MFTVRFRGYIESETPFLHMNGSEMGAHPNPKLGPKRSD